MGLMCAVAQTSYLIIKMVLTMWTFFLSQEFELWQIRKVQIHGNILARHTLGHFTLIIY